MQEGGDPHMAILCRSFQAAPAPRRPRRRSGEQAGRAQTPPGCGRDAAKRCQCFMLPPELGKCMLEDPQRPETATGIPASRHDSGGPRFRCAWCLTTGRASWTEQASARAGTAPRGAQANKRLEGPRRAKRAPRRVVAIWIA